MSYPCFTPSNSRGQPAASWGLVKVLCPEAHGGHKDSHASQHMADSARPFHFPQGSEVADPGHWAPAAPHHSNKSGCLL